VVSDGYFTNLNATDKRNSMLESLVLSDDKLSSNNNMPQSKKVIVKKVYPKCNSTTVMCHNDFKTGRFTTFAKSSYNATIPFSENEQKKLIDKTLYIELKGVDYQSTTEQSKLEATSNPSEVRLAKYLDFGYMPWFRGVLNCLVELRNSNGKSTISQTGLIFNKYYVQGQNVHDLLYNFGVQTKDNLPQSITLNFNLDGNYTFDSINLYVEDNKNLPELVKERSKEQMTNVKFRTNGVSGEISSSKEQFLFMQLPYSEGWKATVNGQKQEVIRCNIMYSCLKIGKGDYKIDLKYRTPLLMEGVWLSGAGLLILLSVMAFRTVRKRRKLCKNLKEVAND
jgi:hypothetical protein